MENNRGNQMPPVAPDVSQEPHEGAGVGSKESQKRVGPPVQVIATRAGFYGGERKVEGDKFTIRGRYELGTWMKIIK